VVGDATPVSAFSAVTFAPAMAAPEGSVTVPVTDAFCANAADAARKSNGNIVAERTFLINRLIP
jgi:hypothetical protein